MTDRRFASIEDALDHAARLLIDRFGDVDQKAAVSLAQTLYMMQEREEFIHRADKETEVPYRS